MIRADSLVTQARRKIIVGDVEARAAVELPLVLQTLPAQIRDLLAADLLAQEALFTTAAAG